MHRLFFILLVTACCSGCSGLGTSRWAMDDPVYAEKYQRPYSSNHVDKTGRMMKQSIDARHVANRGGVFVGGGGANDPATGGAELGAFRYFDSSVEGRGGIKGLIGTGAEDWFAGLDLGLRTQTPTRLAPFAGIGTFLGGNRRTLIADNDGRDNNGNAIVDEAGELGTDSGFLASVYPEAGLHFWLDGRTRLTASAQYHVTTEGRDADFWFFGISWSFLNPNESLPAHSMTLDSDDYVSLEDVSLMDDISWADEADRESRDGDSGDSGNADILAASHSSSMDEGGVGDTSKEPSWDDPVSTTDHADDEARR